MSFRFLPVWVARLVIRDEPGDPTWLAYSLYGDPDATVITAEAG